MSSEQFVRLQPHTVPALITLGWRGATCPRCKSSHTASVGPNREGETVFACMIDGAFVVKRDPPHS